MPFLIVSVVEHFGVRTSFLLLSSVFLHLSILLLLIRPYHIHQRIVLQKKMVQVRRGSILQKDQSLVELELLGEKEVENGSKAVSVEFSRKSSGLIPCQENTLESPQKRDIDMSVDKHSEEKVKGKGVEWKLLKSPLYVSHLVMVLGYAFSWPTLQYFVSRFGESINLSPTENSTLLAYQSILDAGLRLGVGYLLNRKLFNKMQCVTVR